MICAKSAHMINYIAKGLAVSANPVCYITIQITKNQIYATE